MLLLGIGFWLSLPKNLFHDPCSTVIYDRNNILLGARIAKDGQWRFPENDTVPDKFKECILLFEDRYFLWHPGLNPIALCRAFYLNLKSGKTISGGSTLTMQVIRLYRKNPRRSYLEKLIELYLALRLEAGNSKQKILSLYAAHAPFGGNTVGLEAASWRYFGRQSGNLSWSEAASLAVLPNSPAIIFPGKNQERLMQKRNKLLLKLFQTRKIDKATYELSLLEPIPGRPKAIPQQATHLMLRAEKEGKAGQIIHSTIASTMQQNVAAIVEKHHRNLQANEIHNLAAIVANTRTGEVLAYIGNITNSQNQHQENVDIIASPRSTGSILKPFLFASALQEGLLFPNTLIQDIPVHIYGYSPKNFNLSFDGVVPAKRALGRSLNIPAVKMLQLYGTDKFLLKLKQTGMTTLPFSAKHYGLALILGGAEASLWDLTGMYASMARTLISAKKETNFPLKYSADAMQKGGREAGNKSAPFSAGVTWLTLEAMVEVSRPDLEAAWREFSSGSKIAWKTGTSFGFRDGWAIGVNPDYTVGVWVGNATGEGRPGLTGIATAAPVMFDIFSALPRCSWFKTPINDLKKVKLCAESGHPPSTLCPETVLALVQKTNASVGMCSYHKSIFLDKDGNEQVSGDCYSVSEMQEAVYFVLPPVEEWYFKAHSPAYRSLPPFRPGCDPHTNDAALGLIYPTPNAEIFIPRNNENEKLGIVCRATHKQAKAEVFWSLDGDFIQTTTHQHEILINPTLGEHKLNITDNAGERHSVTFRVVEKK